MVQCEYCSAELNMDDVVSSILRGADDSIRDRLREYVLTLIEVGVEPDLLRICASEFLKERTEHDRRYSGC